MWAPLLVEQKLLHGSQQRQALDNINAELDNVRAMWRWALAPRHFKTLDQA